ncbi:MAG: MOSC domain-containing protein [Betaproteobacteria bacterium]|nr:MOSC domain-containing protein [Betaproteobacteria bacterium]
MNTTLTAIHIYPVKALGGISLKASGVTPRGLKNDRRFMVVDADNGFITQRDVPKMATVWMELDNDEVIFSAPDMESISVAAEPQKRPTRAVQVWSSQVAAHSVSAEADAWLSQYLGFDARLVYMPDSSERQANPEYAKGGEIVSFADGFPLLMASEESLADLNARIAATGGTPIPMSRFRPNLVITGGGPYAEDRLGEIRVGDAVFRAVKPCIRCQVTTTDQATGELRGPEPLRTLATYRQSPAGVMFGMNLVPVTLGTVRVGDAVSFAM